MRAIRFLPLVFVVGIDGFAMFAPYVLLVLTLAYLVSRFRGLNPVPADTSVADGIVSPANS
jgi:hypothetical protein